MKVFLPFLVALQFLTRFPIRFHTLPDAAIIGRSLPFYPLVGLLIGASLAALAFLLADAPSPLHAAIVLAVWVGFTGALHLDGLADTADAWVGGNGDRERTLAIMKDPHIGSSAVTTVVLLLLLKFAALASLAPTAWTSILLIPSLARTGPPLLFATTPYVRPGGLGAALSTHHSKSMGLLAVALAWCAAFVISRPQAVWLFTVFVGTFLLARYAMLQRLGGTTGDTAGALIEISEAAMLVTAALLPVMQVA